MNEEIVSYSKDDIAKVLRDLEELVVSLDRIGSYWHDRKNDEEYFEIEGRFLTDWNVFRKLAATRTILSDAFSSELGSDGFDQLERNALNCKFWTISAAFDSRDKYKFAYIHEDIDLVDLENSYWEKATLLVLDKSWKGEILRGRSFAFTGLWSSDALYARFECSQNEPFVISEAPQLDSKTIGLWDRDVVELFVAPDRAEPRKYFEFEAAPTGEWLDVELDSTSGTRVPDWEYNSGMEVTAKADHGSSVIAMKIPWTAFGKKPKVGDVWLGNILRCVGKDPGRGYLAWSPTMTKNPNFHVPERFGEFHFVK